MSQVSVLTVCNTVGVLTVCHLGSLGIASNSNSISSSSRSRRRRRRRTGRRQAHWRRCLDLWAIRVVQDTSVVTGVSG